MIFNRQYGSVVLGPCVLSYKESKDIPRVGTRIAVGRARSAAFLITRFGSVPVQHLALLLQAAHLGRSAAASPCMRISL